jgi:class 3 adenylate cyclase/tetratricopeptide (TPR) repeat protein
LVAPSGIVEGQDELLKPYVPRLLVEWLRDSPEAAHRTVEGSLVFVDISGFTALSERLARRGKIGAELMRDTLDGVFRALLDEAYEWGAGLLKWGGDALLLLFDGPEHPARAARAAWEMQRTLDRVGRLRAGGGTITLRMSIGISTGSIEFFLAGSVHRELLLAGPVTSETLVIEGIADAGEIGISHALARHLDAACVGPAKDEALLLAAPPQAKRERSPDVGSASGLDIASCIPVATRAHVLLERSEPEHRTITAAFIDMMDTDDLLERIGPQALAEALDERLSTIEEAALRYGVPFYETDVGKGSVKALLTAGAPSGTGHDEEQILRALREVMDAPGLVPMRVGVNTGKVFTGDFGPPYRRAYRVFGDAINTAARVMSRAEAGQLLATEIVLDRSRTTFTSTPIEPFKAKGKAEPVRASIVGPITGRLDERNIEMPLIGRDAELEALLRILDDARAGDVRIIEISGAPGIGKSRLVAELLEQTLDLRVLSSGCEEYEAATPYFAMRAVLHALLELEPAATTPEVDRRLREAVAPEPELEPWVPLLGILLGHELPETPETRSIDERFLRETIADVALRFLDATLQGAPTVILVEGVQHMDDASADLLRRFAGSPGAFRPLLLLTRADPASTWADAGESGCAAFTLLPLSVEHTARLVEIATDEEPLPEHDVETVARRSGGNVLFLFELLEAARSTGTTAALPDSVEAVVAAEIDRLSPSDRTVLRYASVLGVSFDPDSLEAAARDEATVDEPLWERLRSLVAAEPGGRMRFRNTLVRDVAYEGLPYGRRRELHGRVAEAIEAAAPAGEEHAATLALHYSEAQRHAEAWHYGRLAGDRARAVAANIEAARFYELALGAARRLRGVNDRERAAVWVSLGAAREAGGLFEQSFEALRRATRLLPGDPVEQARVYALRTRARVRTGSYDLALRQTTAGLRLVAELDAPEAVAARARLRAMRSEVRWLQGHPRWAIELAETAIGEAERSNERESLARAYSVLDGSYQMLGRPEMAVHERRALAILTELGDTRSCGIMELNLGVQAYADGKWDEAIDWYTRAREDSGRAGDRQHTAIAGANLGEVLVSRGELDEAERVLGEARRALRASGAIPFALFAETQLARSALERGDAERAATSLQRIVDEAATIGHAGILLEITVYFAHAQVQVGRADVALEALEAAATAAGEEAALLAAPVERVRAECLLALGRTDKATAALERGLRAAVDQSLLYEQLLILRLRGSEDPEELREIERLTQLLGVI